MFPYYLALGMTERQYWDRDSTLVIAFRKADELKQERVNQHLWLQGAYFYEALCRVSPILHAYAKKGTKPRPYPTEPFAVTQRQAEIEEEERAKKVFEKGKKRMETFMENVNKQFRGGERVGGDS